MFKFILTSYRSLTKQKKQFFINIIGLAIGIASFIFILSYVMKELSYDRWHTNYDRIYRAIVIGRHGDIEINMALTAPPMAMAFLEDIPEVELVCRIKKAGERLAQVKDKSFIEKNILYADSTFFKIFDFNLIKGDPNTVLTEPRSIILSESYAQKYFPNEENLIGKNISLGSASNYYMVKGIVEDAPENSHFHYDMIASLVTLRTSRSTSWGSHDLYTYILARKGSEQSVIEKKMESFIEKYYLTPTSKKQYKESGDFRSYKLQPIKDIHFKSDLFMEIEPNGNLAYTKIFTIIAIFILFMAIINYINLSTAESFSRTKEVGVKKVIGASKRILIFQFLGESIVLSFGATIIALGLIVIFKDSFNQLIGTDISYSFFTGKTLFISIIGLIIFVGVMAGSYPAFVLVSFKPINALKGSISGSIGSIIIRKLLVIFQFAISITIIICALNIYNQLNYMQNKNLGFSKEQLLVLESARSLGTQIEMFKEDLRKNPNVLGVANSKYLPGIVYFNRNITKEGDPEKNEIQIFHNEVSLEYPEVMGVELIRGRYFSNKFRTDSSAIIINETAAKSLGYDDPIGKNILRRNFRNEYQKFPIIGVVKDYNIESLHKKIEPLYLSIMKGNWEGYLIVRLSTNNIQKTISFIEKTWTDYENRQPIQHYFFDQEYNSIYRVEKKASQIFVIFAILAIFIACLGLLGLVTYTSSARTKEIGIRKVHGASVVSLTGLLSTDILKLILVATIIAWIISYFGVQKWLAGFSDHIEINPITFIIPTLLSLILAWLVTSFQTLRLALKNPVEALKYE